MKKVLKGQARNSGFFANRKTEWHIRLANVPMQSRMKRMRKTWQTGTSASARADRILRRDLRRPKIRSTRRARITRTIPVGSSVRTRETSDMPTTNMSIQHHGSVMKGKNQVEKARIASSITKIIVKLRLRVVMAAPRDVGEPSLLTRSSTS